MELINKAYLYKITNVLDGKIYIGITTQTPYRRWIQHKSDAKRDVKKNRRLLNAINKHNPKNFSIEILVKFKNIDYPSLINAEVDFIKKYKATDKSVGYNMTLGGDGVLGHEPWCKGKTKDTDHTLKLISEKQSGRKNSFYGKTHSDELKEKWSKERSGENHPMYGIKRPDLSESNKNRIWTDEAKGKISAKNSKPIICIELNKTFPSIKNMCKNLNLDERSVYRVLKGKFKQHKGFTFKYV